MISGSFLLLIPHHASFFVAHTAIFGIVAVGAVGANVPRMIFVFIFGDSLCKAVMAGAATLFSFHAFHAFVLFEFMVARDTGLTNVFIDMDKTLTWI